MLVKGLIWWHHFGSSCWPDIPNINSHDEVIKWKHFPRNWPFVRGIHRSPVNSLHKGQWRRALMFSLICAWINDWVNNREAGDLRRHRAHYDAILMFAIEMVSLTHWPPEIFEWIIFKLVLMIDGWGTFVNFPAWFKGSSIVYSIEIHIYIYVCMYVYIYIYIYILIMDSGQNMF